MKNLLLLLLSCCFFACKSNTNSVKPIAITSTNRIDYNVYLSNLGKYTEENRADAKKLCEDAKEIEITNAIKSMELYQKSISVYPNAEAYLGFCRTLATQNGSIEQIIGALQMAENLTYQPANELYYEAAKQMMRLDTTFKLKACQSAGGCIDNAVKLGFADVSRLQKDFITEANLLHENYEINDLIRSYLQIIPKNEQEKAVFGLLNMYYKDAKLPFKIDETSIQNVMDSTVDAITLSYSFYNNFPTYNLIRKEMTYDEPNEVYPMAKFAYKNFIAYLTFVNKGGFADFYISTYSKNGKFIDHKKIGVFAFNHFQTFLIKDTAIETQKYKAKIQTDYIGIRNSHKISIANQQFVQAMNFTFGENGELK
jgi:hypothetical protein